MINDATLRLFVYLFAAFGFCWGVGWSVASLPVRKWLASWLKPGVVKCSACSNTAEVLPKTPPTACPMCGAEGNGKDALSWWIVVSGFEPRFALLLTLLECPACLGFWVGLVVGFFEGGLLFALMLAFATTGWNYMLGRATGIIDHP